MIGTTVSHYKILEKLGGGGMGVVYKAQDTRLNRTVALKFLPPDLTRDEEAKTRFVHEAQAASALQHPNICTIHDVDETTDNRLFIVMDCYDGESLKEKIEGGPLPMDKAVDIATQVAQGLAKAHENGIVHRDIKPANIMVGKDGIARIVDFGLAKLSGRTLLTKAGTTLGTAAYMSPEQAKGEQVDQRSDIWSLGIVLYEMLTGKRPFASDYEQALVYSILNEDPKPMSSLRSDIRVELEAIVQKAMAKKPEERYQTITKMLDELEPQGRGAPKTRSWTSRPMARRAVIVLAELGLAGVAIAAILLLTAHSPEIHKMALLPLVDTSKDSTMAEVFDGVTEDVITNLGQMSKAMKVISFNGVVQYKDKQVTPVKAGEELGVDAIAVCRVYRQASSYNLRLEIVNVRDNTSMSNERLTSSLMDIASLPKKMATSILKTFGVTNSEDIAATIGRQQTKNFEAYRLYQLGNHYYHRLMEEDLRKSIEYYRKALAIDPNYALAHAGIALSYSQLAQNLATREIRDSSLTEAIQALELDIGLPEAHLSIGSIKYVNLELLQASQEIERAIELNPSYADAIHMHAHWYAEERQFDKGVEMMRRSIELEPLNPHFQQCLGLTYYEARRWDDAIAAYQKVPEIDPTWPIRSTQHWLAECYRAKGNFQKASEYYRLVVSSKAARGLWGLCYAVALDLCDGRVDDAKRHVAAMPAICRRSGEDPWPIAWAYAMIKDKEQTLKWATRMYDLRSYNFGLVNVFEDIDFLRGDPRFEALMKRAGYRD